MPISIPNFNFLPLLVSEIKRGSQNLMCVLQVLGKFKQPTKFQHHSSMHHAVMRICICHGLSIMCTKQMGFWGGFGGEDVKVLCSDPQKALPCVNKRLLVYRMSKSVQRFKLQVQGMILHTNKEIKKLSDNFGQYRIQRGDGGCIPPPACSNFFTVSQMRLIC